ncbi:hypothetical protein Tco_0844526 [Tanacetum coccineum]
MRGCPLVGGGRTGGCGGGGGVVIWRTVAGYVDAALSLRMISLFIRTTRAKFLFPFREHDHSQLQGKLWLYGEHNTVQEEVAINVIPLATKPAPILGRHGYKMLEEAYERVLLGDLKVMFEPHVEDAVWMNLQGQKILLWKLYDSYGVYFVRYQNMHIYMLAEKTCYLTPATITKMLNKKLQAEYWNEMCYQLLKLMTKLVKKK